MVDYSRFDKIDVSDDDDDDDDNVRSRRPQVHKLEKNQTIKLGDSNITVTSNSSSSAAVKATSSAAAAAAASVVNNDDDDNDEEEEDFQEDFQPSIREITDAEEAQVKAKAKAKAKAEAKADEPKATSSTSSSTKKPQTLTRAAMTRNGGETERYYWSQTKAEVVVYVRAPKTVKASNIRVQLDNKDNQLVVSLKDAPKPLLREKLFGPVTDSGNDDDGGDSSSDFLDWSMQDSADCAGWRLVMVTLQKKPPMAGLVMWWRSAFVGEPEIDTNAIQDRSSADVNKSRSFMDNFKEAQEEFKRRVAERKGQPKVEIDIDASELD